jgi:short-subunit dehydrogenase
MDILLKLGDLWVRRRAKPSRAALDAVRDLAPATLVTGASEGIGLALARLIAREGRVVVMLARTENLLVRAAEELQREAPDALIVTEAIDVGAADAPEQIDALLRRNNLYVDVLVNNAGIGVGGPFANLDAAKLDELVATNVAAVTRLTRHYLPGMRARARGGVMNIASLAAFAPGPWQAPYFASKAYVLSLTAAIAGECSGEGVRVCAIACGPVETGIHRKMNAVNTFYRMLIPSYTPDQIAALAWRSYRLGRRVVVPGVVNSLLAWTMRAIPFELVLPIVDLLMKPRSRRRAAAAGVSTQAKLDARKAP